jgi:lysine biosynthesis protein LysW
MLTVNQEGTTGLPYRIWSNMAKAKCPHCNVEIQMGESPHLGQVFTCTNCGQGFEVVWLFPLALDYCEENSREDAPEAQSE